MRRDRQNHDQYVSHSEEATPRSQQPSQQAASGGITAKLGTGAPHQPTQSALPVTLAQSRLGVQNTQHTQNDRTSLLSMQSLSRLP